MDIPKEVLPDLEAFGVDPFGYSSLAWHTLGVIKTLSGIEVDLSKPPTSDDLKTPTLWLCHSHALFLAGKSIIKTEPEFTEIAKITSGICHSQYHAVALMLFGLSLESSLKVLLIINEGIEKYTEQEKKRKHHRLHVLADFVPDLSEKDIAILKALTHFIYWAGKYPDPGSGRAADAESVFELSEEHEICAWDLFDLIARIANYVELVVHEK